MQTANQTLQALRKMGDKRLPLTRVYRCLFNEELFLVAYDKIRRNQGALTPGTGDDTADGMSRARIRSIIDALRAERFRFRPARRIHIPKKSGGSRPLGLPDFTEKLVQEVLRMILEAYYEPRFRESSHGFRSGRGCHTALTAVHQKFQGAAWLIEGDIRGCFDNLNHQVLLDTLSKDIHDGRLLNLIRMSLQAGALDGWTYHKTYSGTPQGGVLSPLLANIYLHELDVFIEETLIPQHTRGEKRAKNPAYSCLSGRIDRARARKDTEAVQQWTQLRRQLPSQDTHDPNYRRLSYVRYADDFVLGFIGPKAEAETIKAAIGTFLREKLQLEMSVEKTLITHARTEQARFLGYSVSVYHADDKLTRRAQTSTKVRSINGGIRLGLPANLIHEASKAYQRDGKVVSEARLLAWSDAQIIDTYQQRYRGLVEYYKFAIDRARLSSVKYVMEQSLVKTLAHKNRISVAQVYRKYRGKLMAHGREYVTLQVAVPVRDGERLFHWGAIPLKVVQPGNIHIDDTRHVDWWKGLRSDLVRRLQADACELCGSHENCEVHHVRKLADLKQRWAGRRTKPEWVVRMITVRRKTLVVCHACHQAIHTGRPLPKRRTEVLESRVS
jgi:group II intron reverse transcriptase/maturase